ncbi:MAG: hypothetical protein GY701_31650 [Sulfitobacter sp.]|nr:hypothetical protein [Sulfitobacter sp.]MCP3938380.1 hypothetical protein [Actinomycetes bacterium]
MRRFIIATGLAAAVALIVREMAGKMAPAMRARCADACERMLGNMPESFPPNRMMADLEVLKERTTRILDLVDRPTADQSRGSPSLRDHPIPATRP